MQKVRFKPLSVNEAWQGKRFKTEKYKNYEQAMFLLLPRGLIIPPGKLEVFYKFGFSSKLADNDNPVKPLQDILCKRYNFKDNRIYLTHIMKEDVPVGQEYIAFHIQEFKEQKSFAFTQK